MLRILTVARATFWETIRQPIFGIVLCLAAALIALSPSFAMFSLLENVRLVKEMGLSTIFVAGLVLAVLSSTGGVTGEIEGGTAVTLLSKPLSRAAFVLGKFFGLGAGLAVAVYLLCIVLLFAVRVGVPEAAWSRLDLLPLWAGLGAAIVSASVGFLGDYFFDRHFQATAVSVALVTFTAAFVVLGFVGPGLSPGAFPAGMDMGVARACLLVCAAVLLMVAAGVAFSTRLSYGAAVLACAVFGLWGLLSDYAFGRLSAEVPAAAVAYAVSPNLQALWAADAVSAGRLIPGSYIGLAVSHAGLWVAALLFCGVAAFEGRELSGRV